MTIVNWLYSQSDCKLMDYFVNLAVAIGSYKILSNLWRLTSFLSRQWIRPFTRPSLVSQYGSKQGRSWAVITGGSDGIGLAMAKKLAREGFNICIVARNADKMSQK